MNRAEAIDRLVSIFGKPLAGPAMNDLRAFLSDMEEEITEEIYAREDNPPPRPADFDEEEDEFDEEFDELDEDEDEGRPPVYPLPALKDATHGYVGVCRECGGWVMMAVECEPCRKTLAEYVGDAILDGYEVRRVTLDEGRAMKSCRNECPGRKSNRDKEQA